MTELSLKPVVFLLLQSLFATTWIIDLISISRSLKTEEVAPSGSVLLGHVQHWLKATDTTDIGLRQALVELPPIEVKVSSIIRMIKLMLLGLSYVSALSLVIPTRNRDLNRLIITYGSMISTN